RDVPSHLCISATDPRWMEEVQSLRKRRYGSSPREHRRLQISKIVRARRTEERAVSLPLQRESKRSAQGTGRQRRLQSARWRCDSCRIGGREIGRASCRERVEIPVATDTLKAKTTIVDNT